MSPELDITELGLGLRSPNWILSKFYSRESSFNSGWHSLCLSCENSGIFFKVQIWHQNTSFDNPYAQILPWKRHKYFLLQCWWCVFLRASLACVCICTRYFHISSSTFKCMIIYVYTILLYTFSSNYKRTWLILPSDSKLEETLIFNLNNKTKYCWATL